jgi:hypothetical protein
MENHHPLATPDHILMQTQTIRSLCIMHMSGGFAIIHRHHLLVLRLHLYLTMKDHSLAGASEVLFVYPALVVWSLEGSSEPLWKRLLLTLHWVIAAKYSPQGDHIATATLKSVRVWDSNEGRLLVDIKVTVTPWFNTGLLWFNDNLFVAHNLGQSGREELDVSELVQWCQPPPTSESRHVPALVVSSA